MLSRNERKRINYWRNNCKFGFKVAIKSILEVLFFFKQREATLLKTCSENDVKINSLEATIFELKKVLEEKELAYEKCLIDIRNKEKTIEEKIVSLKINYDFKIRIFFIKRRVLCWMKKSLNLQK